MAIKFYSLGAAQEVTGSKHILEVDGHKYLIDCGAFQGKRAEADKKNRDFNVPTQELEAVILTHAHYDHCGLLPLLGKHGFNGNIYATPATRDIANLVMMDSARIQARDREYLSKQAAKKGESFKWVPLFDEADVIQTVNQFVTISYHRPAWIGPNVQLEFYDAGHILGSAMAVITAKDSDGKEVKIAFTGDLGRKNKAIIRDPDIIPPVDYIVIESTYGNRRHEETDNALKLLAEKTQEIVQNKGKMIIPAFAVERTQEIVYYFHLLVDKKIIPNIPIYVDSPMAVNATSIFQVHPECYDAETHEAFLTHHKNPFGFNSLKFITSVTESKELNNIDGPMVIISADGMCEFGRITHHLANNIEKPSTKVMLVGFMAEDTLGRRLQNREQEVKIFGEWHQVRAEILQINAFSAHADYFESREWLDSLENHKLKRIFLVHGEPKAQTYFTQYLNENGYKDVKTVKYGEIIAWTKNYEKKTITGFHAIDEILRAEKLKIEKEKNRKPSLEIFYSKEGPRVKKILEAARKLNLKIEKKDNQFLDSLSKTLPEQLRDHRGIVLVTEAENQKKGMSVDEFFARLEEKDSAFVVILDSVTDPHNTGSIIRSADQFGIDGILVPENKSAGGFEIISKVSAGALAWVPFVEVTNLVRTIERLKKEGFWIYGADAGGKALPDLTFPKKTGLIMGSEGRGMSRLVEETCDEIVSIPTKGKLDSLNVSVAAGILLYEISRKKEV